MRNLSLVMSECSLSGRGQGHMSNFYIVDLRKFRHSKSSVYRWYTQLDRCRFVYDTYKTMKATWMRHGWVHMFITHQPILTLQLHNLDLFRTCRTSSFCTVAWQLARFQLTWCITRSLVDSWASCRCWLQSAVYNAAVYNAANKVSLCVMNIFCILCIAVVYYFSLVV